MNVFYNNTKSNVYNFHFRFSPTLIHFYLFPNKKKITHFRFDKIVHSWFSRATFATELSTYLVYKSIFVIYYYYIFIHLLFFFTVELSIFSRLCVNHKRVWAGQHTLGCRNSTLIKKNLPRYRIDIGIDRYSEFLVSVIKKWYRASPSIVAGTLYCEKAPSFRWDVKPRSWLSVIIKNPRMFFEKE